MVTPIASTVITAKTGFKKWSTGQGVFLPLVKQSRTIFTSPPSFCNGVYINAQGSSSGWIGFPIHQNEQATVSGAWAPGRPDWLAIFWRALNTFTFHWSELQI